MNTTIYEYEQMISEQATIQEFLDVIKDAQENKEHITIDIVMIKDGANFSSIINGINADDIKYIEKTGCIGVGGCRDCYSLTISDGCEILTMDATPDNCSYMVIQYSFWKDDLSVTFLFTYDDKKHLENLC